MAQVNLNLETLGDLDEGRAEAIINAEIAAVIEAHRAQLIRGENWPGDAIKLPGFDDEKPAVKAKRRPSAADSDNAG